MSDDILARNSLGELSVRTTSTVGDTGLDKNDVYTRDSQGRLCVRTVGGGGGGDYDAEIQALNNAVSILSTSVNISPNIGASTTVPLSELTAIDIDGRPSYKAAGATVYAENGVVGIIDAITGQNAAVVTVQVATGDSNNNGIKGDYCSTYGITDMPNGVITTPAENNNLNIPAGIILKAAGSDTLTTLASATTHQTQSVDNFTLFYAGGDFLECGSVHYSEIEPATNGETNYQAWYSPIIGSWQFRSNDTGNVWRTAVATPLCDCIFTNGNITRIDFIGYRVLNKQEFATKAEIGDIATVLNAINGEDI